MVFLSLLFLGRSQTGEIPVFNCTALNETLNLESDTTYVLNFWATWCKPCVEELPFFEEANIAYKDRAVRILLVSLDFVTQIDEKLVPFLKDHTINSHVVLLDDPDANTWIDLVHPDWTGALPATILYRHKDRQFKEGSFDSTADLFAYIDSFHLN